MLQARESRTEKSASDRVSACDLDVQVLSKTFRGLHEWDTTIQRLKVIAVLPQCSSSALSDPVAAIHSEHGGNQLAGME